MKPRQCGWFHLGKRENVILGAFFQTGFLKLARSSPLITIGYAPTIYRPRVMNAPARLARLMCCAAALMGAAHLSAAELKKVLILDVVNIDKEANFDYLQGSITDGLQAKLRERFSFSETRKADWQEAARVNKLVFTEESYTRTYALDLGLAMKQDIAISGGFKVRTKNGKQILDATLFILDVQKRQEIDFVRLEMPTDAELFGKVDELAARLAQAAGKVLPSKDQADNNSDNFTGGDHALSVVGRITPFAIQGLKKFDETDLVLRPSQFPMALEFGVKYQIANFWRRYGLWTQGLFFMSGNALQSAQRSATIPNSTLGGNVLIGTSMTFDVAKRTHVIGRLGGGFFLGVATLDFSNYPTPALDVNSSTLTQVSSVFYGSLISLGADVQYDLSARMFLESGLTLQSFINGKSISTTAVASVGVGWRF
jgi:hypothetical protein